MTWIRALAAAGLSVFLPGAGHALLRDWIRALLFAGLFVSSVVIFFPIAELSAAGSTADAMAVVEAETSTVNQLFVTFIVLFAAVDAALRAVNVPPGTGGDTDGTSCPSCGKELDEDLEFCHWCTTRLGGGDENETEEKPAS
ncbi:DUF7575 domain-containing protein [Natrialbaceae archaeon AArc-T1-2]|uniref:DUF7575 domain-containing protein n=1 Tax=Natrialbaceae archaeon AArc-T1-2 TaxID=3053904 RepID=UPI00255AF842|nr:zinc ribbon domain-containing protein [Natrialbaceae archaeon AArc-T1-2]WIV68708.1 zinc ribbon domain-containing protein [Natrialbaceae archaeon AArc-T1-2]